MDKINYFSVTALMNGLISAGLGIFIVSRNYKEKKYWTFGLLCLVMSWWAFSYFFWQITDSKEMALFWCRMLMAGAIFTPFIYLHHLQAALLYDYHAALIRKIIKFGYFLAGLFLIWDLTPYYVASVEPKSIFKYWPNPGILYHIYLVPWSFYVFCTLFILYDFYKKEKSADLRKRAKILFYGSLIIWGGSGFNNYLLWYDINIPPWGNGFMSLYLMIVAYIIFRYKWLEIELIIKKTLVFAGLLASVSALLILPTLLIQDYIFRSARFNSWLKFFVERMNYFAIVGLINAMTSTILGLFVYTRDKKDIRHITFFIFCCAVALWNYGYFLWQISNSYTSAVFWCRVLMVGAFLVPGTFLHYTLELLDLNRGGSRKILLYGYIFDFITLLFIFSPAVVPSVSHKLFFKYWPNPSILYNFMMCKFLIYSMYSHYLLYKGYKAASGVRYYQLRLSFWAIVVGYIGGLPTIPLWYNIPVIPYTHIFVSGYMVMLAYGIVQYRMFNIEVIIKKTFVFAGLLASVFAIFILPTLLIQEYILRTASFGSRMVGFTISGIIIILTMRSIETFLVSITDKYLFQKKYDYKELLKTFTSEVLTVLDLDKLTHLTVTKLKEIMRLQSCRIEILDQGATVTAPSKDEFAIPITMQHEMVGTLYLGKKLSDRDYNQDDLDILHPLARTLAIAISNAKLIDELSKTQADAAQKEKMATIGTLAAGMAHEIRNPITTIRVFSEYLPDKMKEPQFVEKYRNTVLKQVDRIDHIVQTMVDFSAEDAPNEIEPVSLREKVVELITLMNLSNAATVDIEFKNNVPWSIPIIKVNEKELDEILLNITQNAVHAIKGKGEIDFNAYEKGDMIVLEIKDSGCGMSEDVSKQIFNPFFTTKSKGYGLGLFVVKDLVDRNNGKIVVESVPGKGTKFVMEFHRF